MMLSIDAAYRQKGYGSMLLKHWEKDMKSKHYDMVLTSTQVDECTQPMELFLIKEILGEKMKFNDIKPYIVDQLNHRMKLNLDERDV